MIIKKADSKIEKISFRSNVWDYPMPSEQVGIAFQELDGRVPDNNWYKNTKCYEICYIISGQGKFFIEDEQFDARVGDVVIIETNKKSYIEARCLKMITVTRPNWYEKQCSIVE
ncbi:MAG: AraC family ligand binding domain-containing protein [Candidatus Pacebacteria bacterium]|nr:AraC family ligand binding domain-containing protein [Candidatus Paceibacterota bacterium]